MALWYYQKAVDLADPTERIVADVLRELDDRWTIRWGWYYIDNCGIQQEGDFLIQGPQGHILVLEVKATQLRSFPLNGYWETDNGDDRDPISQLCAQWSWVLDKLRADGHELPYVARAFALPNFRFLSGEKPGGELTQSMVLDRAALNNFPSWWQKHIGTRPTYGRDHRNRFIRLFATGLQPAQIRLFLRNTEEIFSRFRGSEFDLLKRVWANRQLLVRGGPGTSKTFMALRLAEMMAVEGEGREVLLLCYNRALGESFKDLAAKLKLQRGAIHVLTWEALALDLLASNVSLNAPDDPQQRSEFYDYEIPGYLRMALDEGLVTPRYDAMVVDEGQDIDTRDAEDRAPGWWTVLFALLREGSSARMAVFYDPAQRADFRPARFAIDDIVPRLSQPAFIRLNRSVRYTAPIFNFLINVAGDPRHPIFEGLEIHPHAPQGPAVVRVTADAARTASAVERILKDWFKTGLCKERDICILGPRGSLHTSSLAQTTEILSRPLIDYPLSDTSNAPNGDAPETATKPTAQPDAIRYLSLHRAKGLDFLAVILIDQPCQPTAPFLLAASRARQLLAVVEPTVNEA